MCIVYMADKYGVAIADVSTGDFYVTEVDTTVQKLLFEKLSALYPDIQFMGEEQDNHDIDFSKPVWILDPVDGTTNLIHRYPASCISLGLVANGEPSVGIIFNPYYDELFFAIKGEGASPF